MNWMVFWKEKKDKLQRNDLQRIRLRHFAERTCSPIKTVAIVINAIKSSHTESVARIERLKGRRIKVMADLSCITVDGNPGERKKDDIEIKCAYFIGFTLGIDNFAFIKDN